MYADSIADVAVDKDLAPPHAVTKMSRPSPCMIIFPELMVFPTPSLAFPKTVTVGPSIKHSQIVSRGAIDIDLELAC